MGVGSISVPEVMAFVNHYKIIVSPVDPFDRQTDGSLSAVPGKVRMVKHIISEAIFGQRIVYQISPIGHPVFRKLFRAEDQYILVPSFIIFNDSQSRKGLAKTYTVRQDAAIVLFQFIDDSQHCIFLEIIELIPDLAVLESGRLIGQDIF